MDFKEIQQRLKEQKDFFASGKTLMMDFRISQLKQLRKSIKMYEGQLLEALYADLHKSAFEAFATEMAVVYEEIDRHTRKLKRWDRWHVKHTPASNFAAMSYITYQPYGHVLIVAPWNYPFQLLFLPLVGAISAGNVITLKPSEYLTHTPQVMQKIIGDTFAPKYISLFQGEKQFNQQLVKEPWDFIFFTGSPRVGKIIMKQAAERLTPVVLELGGKSPVVVSRKAKLKLAARRIIWGKLINAGQTCIAPDYLLVDQQVAAPFMELLQEEIIRFVGKEPRESPDFPRISTQANVERLEALISSAEVYYGGETDREARYVSPTLLYPVNGIEPVMQQEIFGPVLPVLRYESIQEALHFINARPKPLALYVFSEDKRQTRYVLHHTSSGGAAINDVIMHVANPHLPFGGVGPSGQGRYHGRESFRTFSNTRAVLEKATWIDIPLRYPPYTKKKLNWVKRLM